MCIRTTPVPNAVLLEGFPNIEAMLVERRLRFAGHCWPLQTKVGRPPLTYPKMLSKDTGIDESCGSREDLDPYTGHWEGEAQAPRRTSHSRGTQDALINANKKMVQLVCVVCRMKGCSAPHDHHQPPDYVKCVCCDRTTSAACLSSDIQDMDCFLCNDCHVLTDDM
eukprot:TRINITY_DN5292_c0_g2_i8.p1 TRINITY_DN5292_c0_g2~~TRINITY_DN5292_c0_g2_i8.p1  ORF type:complete len:166 (-),score=28.58 TRINITY_DN5292_c0_g2_i8:86-583(-)